MNDRSSFFSGKNLFFFPLTQLTKTFLPNSNIAKNWGSNLQIWAQCCNAAVLYAREQFRNGKMNDLNSVIDYFSQCRFITALILNHENTLSVISKQRTTSPTDKLTYEDCIRFGHKRRGPLISGTIYLAATGEARPFLNEEQFQGLRSHLLANGRDYQNEDQKDLISLGYRHNFFDQVKIIENTHNNISMSKVFYLKLHSANENIAVVHPTDFSQLIKEASTLFENITQNLNSKSFVDDILSLARLLFNACFLSRGSNAVVKLILNFIVSLHGFCFPPVDDVFPLDFLAMSYGQQEFINAAKEILKKAPFSSVRISNQKQSLEDDHNCYFPNIYKALCGSKLDYSFIVSLNVTQLKIVDIYLENNPGENLSVKDLEQYFELFPENNLFFDDHQGFVINTNVEEEITKMLIPSKSCQ